MWLVYLARDPACQWTLVLAIVASVFCLVNVRRDMGWLASLLLLYVITSAMYIWIFTLNRYYPVVAYDQQALRFHAADAILKLLFLAVPVVLIPVRRLDFWGSAFWPIFAMLNAGLALGEWVKQGCDQVNVCGAIIGNPSMMASFLAVTVPLIMRYEFGWYTMLPFVCWAIALSKSSVGAGLLAAALGMELLARLDFKIKGGVLSMKAWYAAALPLCLAPLGAIVALVGKAELINDSARFRNWKVMMHAWDTPWNRAYGTGFGTFPVMSLNIKRFVEEKLKVPKSLDWFYTMHNDWLEGLFWGGVVGLVLMVAVYLLCLYRLSREKNRAGLRSMILYGLFMAMNFPQHEAWTSAYGIWLVGVALKGYGPLQWGRYISYWTLQVQQRLRRAKCLNFSRPFWYSPCPFIPGPPFVALPISRKSTSGSRT